MDPEDDEQWISLTGKVAERLESEARREITVGHELFGIVLSAVSKCPMCDTVAFRLPDESFALVHLTWKQGPDSPPWPMTTRLGGFISLESAVELHSH